MPKGRENNDIETARAIEEAQKPQDDTITLSTGVILKGWPANPVILIQVMAAFPRPNPPMYFNTTMGREMENPDDPAYIEQLQSWKMDYSDRMATAMIKLGTELVSVPKKFGTPSDNEWLADYADLGLPMRPQSASWRYLTWVKFRAVKNEKDLQAIMEVVGRLSGVREKTIKSAENFPGSDQESG